MRKSAFLAATILAAAGTAQAQNFPSQPISIVVPFSAGGPTDTVTRLVAQAMSADLGVNVIVENVGGAGGTLGAARVSQADPTGYNLLLHHIGMATTAVLYRELPYDALNGFAHIGLVTEVPMTLVARSDFPADDLAGVISYVQEHGEDVMYANAGIGAASHLCGLLFMNAIDTQMTTIPYQGTGPALTDLLGGQVDLMCDQTTNTTVQIREGGIRAYATTTAERIDSLPDLPTALEQGLEGFEVSIWHGLYAPDGTPEDVVARLSQSLQVALADPTVIERFADLGTAPSPAEDATPEALRAKVEAEINLWRPIIEAAGVYAN